MNTPSFADLGVPRTARRRARGQRHHRPRSPSRSTPCPTPSPAATCSAAARPAPARPSRSPSRWSRASARARRRQPPPRHARSAWCSPRPASSPPRSPPSLEPLADGLRPEGHHDLRRRLAAPPGRRAQRRRRHRRRLPRPPRRPHEAGLVTPRRRRDHRARRGRPHGRPRLPARRHAHPDTPPRPAASACCSRATLDNGVDKLVKRFLHNQVLHSVDEANSPVAAMTHHVFDVDGADAKKRARAARSPRAPAAASCSCAPSTTPRSWPSS